MNLYFVTQVRADFSQLKTMLQNIKKGSLTVNEYLLKVKSAIDRLASVEQFISDADVIEAIFNWLPEDYDTLIISVNS